MCWQDFVIGDITIKTVHVIQVRLLIFIWSTCVLQCLSYINEPRSMFLLRKCYFKNI